MSAVNAESALLKAAAMIPIVKKIKILPPKIDRNGLNTSTGAEAQGANRYQRGKYYFSEAKRISAKGGYSLNWDKYEVTGVAHEYAKMAAAGAKILY